MSYFTPLVISKQSQLRSDFADPPSPGAELSPAPPQLDGETNEQEEPGGHWVDKLFRLFHQVHTLRRRASVTSQQPCDQSFLREALTPFSQFNKKHPKSCLAWELCNNKITISYILARLSASCWTVNLKPFLHSAFISSICCI